jgi:hypothetical protein
MYGIYESGNIIAQFVAPMSVRSNVPVFASDTFSLTRVTSKRTAQRWEIETRLFPLSVTANDLFVLFVTKGYSSAIQIVVPQNYGSISNRTSASVPNAVGAVNSTIIAVTGNVGLIPKGTFIKFSSHSKIYLTTTARDGDGNMGIFPALRMAVNTTFTHRDDVLMNCYIDLDTLTGMSYSDGILMDNGTIRLIEDVS